MAGDGDRLSERRASAPAKRRRGSWWLLLLPFLALLVPPLYAHDAPRVFGIPFFYWYQVVWLLLTAVITTVCYRRAR